MKNVKSLIAAVAFTPVMMLSPLARAVPCGTPAYFTTNLVSFTSTTPDTVNLTCPPSNYGYCTSGQSLPITQFVCAYGGGRMNYTSNTSEAYITRGASGNGEYWTATGTGTTSAPIGVQATCIPLTNLPAATYTAPVVYGPGTNQVEVLTSNPDKSVYFFEGWQGLPVQPVIYGGGQNIPLSVMPPCCDESNPQWRIGIEQYQGVGADGGILEGGPLTLWAQGILLPSEPTVTSTTIGYDPFDGLDATSQPLPETDENFTWLGAVSGPGLGTGQHFGVSQGTTVSNGDVYVICTPGTNCPDFMIFYNMALSACTK